MPATERTRGERLVGFGEPDAVQDLGDPVVVGVAVEPLVLVLHDAIVLHQDNLLSSVRPGHGGLQPLQTSAQAENVRPAV